MCTFSRGEIEFVEDRRWFYDFTSEYKHLQMRNILFITLFTSELMYSKVADALFNCLEESALLLTWKSLVIMDFSILPAHIPSL